MGQIYSLIFNEAKEIVVAALQTLETQSNVASVVIVNRDGTEIIRVVMDGVRPFTSHVASLKAKQAAWTGRPTSKTRDEIDAGEKNSGLLGINVDVLVPWAGGMPIYDQEGHLLGGVGVSNLTQEEDEMVAENAIYKAGFKVN